MDILANRIKMNFGNYENPLTDKQVFEKFRGSSMQTFFTNTNNLKVSLKEQQFKHFKDCPIEEFILSHDLDKSKLQQIMIEYDLMKFSGRMIKTLSGGEMQRLLCAITCNKDADIYLFDEPTSFLDVKQRLMISDKIRQCITNKKNNKDENYVVVVDHDMSILDYISDYVIILYGKQSVYGVCSTIYPIAIGINAYLDGYLPKDNMRFRKESYIFDKIEMIKEEINDSKDDFYWDSITCKHSTNFELSIESGKIKKGTITVLMGSNGTGKTSFANMLIKENKDRIKFAYKKQNLELNEQIVRNVIGDMTYDATFIMEIIKPLKLEELLDRSLNKLSGGELQKTMIASCLAKNAQLYIMDEPSAYIDLETRIILSKILRKYTINNRKMMIIIDHDIMMTTYLADNVIIFEGEPGIKTVSRAPMNVEDGMNLYLKNLGITLRNDTNNNRKRINKPDSQKDKEQKFSGKYYQTK